MNDKDTELLAEAYGKVNQQFKVGDTVKIERPDENTSDNYELKGFDFTKPFIITNIEEDKVRLGGGLTYIVKQNNQSFVINNPNVMKKLNIIDKVKGWIK